MKAFLVLMAAVPILGWVVSLAAVYLYMHSRAVDVLERWAKREGYRLARARGCGSSEAPTSGR